MAIMAQIGVEHPNREIGELLVRFFEKLSNLAQTALEGGQSELVVPDPVNPENNIASGCQRLSDVVQISRIVLSQLRTGQFIVTYNLYMNQLFSTGFAPHRAYTPRPQFGAIPRQQTKRTPPRDLQQQREGGQTM
jgi:hypothetical protein